MAGIITGVTSGIGRVGGQIDYGLSAEDGKVILTRFRTHAGGLTFVLVQWDLMAGWYQATDD